MQFLTRIAARKLKYILLFVELRCIKKPRFECIKAGPGYFLL